MAFTPAMVMSRTDIQGAASRERSLRLSGLQHLARLRPHDHQCCIEL